MDNRDLQAENEELRIRLEEAEEMLTAIRSGEVDALVVSSDGGDRIFTLEGADQPYRVLVESMSEGAATLNPDSTVRYCNSRLAHLLGMPLERILGKPFLAHVAPADALVLASLFQRALADCPSGESFRAELTLLAEKGHAVPALLSCCSLDLAGHRGISLIVTDLSEQKRNVEIVAAGELASSILEQAGEAIIVCDGSGRVIRASRQALELFGVDPVYRHFDQLGQLQKAHSGLPFSIDGPLSGMVIKALEVESQHQDRRLHLLLNARPLRRQQKIFGCVITLTDITGRKQTEEKLKKAQAAAEEASRAKSEFLANMSHEIRTPMTVFMVALERLLQIDSNPERRQLLEIADQSAQRLRSLIDDILDFSSIEARRVDLEEQPLDLRACVQSAVEMMRLRAQEKNLHLEADLSPELPTLVRGDADRLGQILLNLIGNAIKFTDAGEVRVSVQARADRLRFAVSDTGIGIPEEKRSLIFQSFRQADSSFKRKFGGTGLGLAISEGLVRLMGGEIGVRDRDGGGSVFFFTLPLKAVEEGVPAAAEQPVETPRESEFQEARILLAEDEPMIRDMVLLTLALRGWSAETAKTGRETVEKWAEGDFDLILMDLQMPDLDGLEATRQIRQMENGHHVCIVGLTAHVRPEVQEECLAAGMNRVLTKPVRTRELFSTIENCLAER